jgi:hypothetical protein
MEQNNVKVPEVNAPEVKTPEVDAPDLKAKALGALDKSKVSGKVIQVLIGLVLTYLTYLLSLAIMKSDSFKSENITTPVKKEVTILDGYADSSALSIISFNTVLPFVPHYMPIRPSVNFKGGAQFTYSTWLNISNPDDTSLLNKCIFLRGDKKKYNYDVRDNVTGEKRKLLDYFTYCPMVSFGNNKLDFVVKFNTNNKLDETMYAQRIESDNSVYRKNILSIIQTNWIMLTVIFEDNIPLNDFENGVRVQLYLNDLLYETKYYKGMLKQNTGNLYFFPEGALNGVRLANMMYFNHAISSNDVKQLYYKKPGNKTASTIIKSTQKMPLVNVSAGNILDLYNT